MKTIKAYLRIAENPSRRYKVAISTKPNPATLFSTNTYGQQIPLPTIRFGVKINIPDDMFDLEKTIDTIELTVSKNDVK